jgi:hypothetical protein
VTLENFVNTEFIGLDTNNSQTQTKNAFVLGEALTNNVNMVEVADGTARLAEVESTGGKGGFVYEQDNGGLYYSANGNFASGGVLIGYITTNGHTPWTYQFSVFKEF